MSEWDDGKDSALAGIAADFEDEESSTRYRRACRAGIPGQRAVLCHPGTCTHKHAYLSDGVVVTASSSVLIIGAASISVLEKRSAPPVIEPLETYPIKSMDGKLFVRVTKEQARAR